MKRKQIKRKEKKEKKKREKKKLFNLKHLPLFLIIIFISLDYCRLLPIPFCFAFHYVLYPVCLKLISLSKSECHSRLFI